MKVTEEAQPLQFSRPLWRRRRKAATARAGVALAGLLLVAGSASAQPLTIARFLFNLSNPGARSLGFGGAFAALADDATAAFANPAGLVQLTRTEVSAETRLWSRSPSFLAGGRIEGAPTGIGIDTADHVIIGRDESDILAPSFASVVVPKGRFTFALYGHRMARFEVATESQGLFLDDPGSPFGTGRFPATREQVDLEVVTAGAAVAWRASERFSLGLSVVYSDLSLYTATRAFLPDDDTRESLFAPVSFLPERQISSIFVELDDEDVTLSGGLLWSVTDRVSAALFYHQGGSGDGALRFEVGIPPGVPPVSGRSRFEVPDVWGGGLAYRSGDGHVTLAAEADRVGYEGLVSFPGTSDEILVGRELRDAWEYHLGFEYALLRPEPVIAFRCGGWVEANGEDVTDDRFTHLAVGVGVAGKRIQVDVGADFSEEVDTASVSLIYSF